MPAPETTPFKAPPADVPPIAFGIAAVCLGTIGLMLFILPILSIPISGFGLLAGAWGAIRGRSGERVALRWSLIGCVLCISVMVIGVILIHAPLGELPSRAVPPQYPKPPDRPYVSPPANPLSDRWAPETARQGSLCFAGARVEHLFEPLIGGDG
jgi:hypothetical protein